MIGSADVEVKYESQVFTLPVVVVKGKGPNLFGRNWMKLNWPKLHNIESQYLTLQLTNTRHSLTRPWDNCAGPKQRSQLQRTQLLATLNPLTSFVKK